MPETTVIQGHTSAPARPQLRHYESIRKKTRGADSRNFSCQSARILSESRDRSRGRVDDLRARAPLSFYGHSDERDAY